MRSERRAESSDSRLTERYASDYYSADNRYACFFLGLTTDGRREEAHCALKVSCVNDTYLETRGPSPLLDVERKSGAKIARKTIHVSREINNIHRFARTHSQGLITSSRPLRWSASNLWTINTPSGSRVLCAVNSSVGMRNSEGEGIAAAALSRRLRDTVRNTQYHFPGTVGDPHFSRGLAVQFHTVVNTLLLFLTSSSILLTLSPCRANSCRCLASRSRAVARGMASFIIISRGCISPPLLVCTRFLPPRSPARRLSPSGSVRAVASSSAFIRR